MATIKFIVRGNSETSSIYIRFKEGRLIDLTAKTKFIINSAEWSNVKGRPKNLKGESLKSIDSKLSAFRSSLLEHYNRTSNKLDVTNDWLKDFINPRQKVTETPDKLALYYDYYALHKNSSIGYTTRKKLNVQKNLILRFQQPISPARPGHSTSACRRRVARRRR